MIILNMQTATIGFNYSLHGKLKKKNVPINFLIRYIFILSLYILLFFKVSFTHGLIRIRV